MTTVAGRRGMARTSRAFMAGMAAGMLAAVTGCGGRQGVEVTGAVTREVGGVVTGGDVVLEPADGATDERRAARTAIRDGRYRFDRTAGVQPGAYVIRVNPPSILPGVGDENGAGLFTPASRIVTVTAAENVFDLTVEPLTTFLP